MNTDSCEMVRQPDVEAVITGPVGSFVIRNCTDNDHYYDLKWKHMWLKLPCGMVSAIDLGGPHRPQWSWDGNEDRPTLSPSVSASTWHGYIRGGRMESV